MKKYIIKNYKGNIVESLKKFQEKYPKSKIIESKVDGKNLKIITEDLNDLYLEYFKAIEAFSNSFTSYIGIIEKITIDTSGRELYPNSFLKYYNALIELAKNTDYLETNDKIFNLINNFKESLKDFNENEGINANYNIVKIGRNIKSELENIYDTMIRNEFNKYKDDNFDDCIETIVTDVLKPAIGIIVDACTDFNIKTNLFSSYHDLDDELQNLISMINKI